MLVLNSLKPGLDEKLYENALVIELRNRGHVVEQQKAFPVHYTGQLIGRLIPDLIVDEKVIVDPKVVEDFNDTHLAQMTGYLAITATASCAFAQLQERGTQGETGGSRLKLSV